MSRNGDLIKDWAGEERAFRLAWGELEKLQEVCDAGPFYILGHLKSGMPKIEYILEVIRWGLIGGGLDVNSASKLVNVYVKERPLAENMLTAQLILLAAIHGVPDEPPKK